MSRFEPIPTELEELSRRVIDSAMKVHRTLGPGLLECVYEQCLVQELRTRGVPVAQQVPVQIVYEGTVIQGALKLDLLVGDELIVELKAVEQMIPLYEAQLLTYLKLSQKRLGLLINFNVSLLKHGIKRLIRTPSTPSSPS